MLRLARLPRVPPSGAPPACALWGLLLPWLCSHVAAQPPAGVFLARRLDARPLTCPDGYYRTSGIIWGCGAALGRRIVDLGPKAEVLAATLPAGLKNFSAQVTSAAHVNVVLEIAEDASSILSDGKVSKGYAAPEGPVLYKRPSEGTQLILISDTLADDMHLRMANLADKSGSVQLNYRFDGISPCPKVPAGCSAFDKDQAADQIKSWRSWAKEKYQDADVAWEALSAIAQGSAGESASRRLAAAAEISWQGWRNVWKYWRDGDGKDDSGWQQSFHLLDTNHDDKLSKEEFDEGFNPGGADARKTADKTADKADDEAADEAADKTAASGAGSDKAARKAADKTAASGAGSEKAAGKAAATGAGFPFWILLLVPLVAIAVVVYCLRTNPAFAAMATDKASLAADKALEVKDLLMQQLGMPELKHNADPAADGGTILLRDSQEPYSEREVQLTLLPQDKSAPSSGSQAYARQRCCTSCVWGREEKPKPLLWIPQHTQPDVDVEAIIKEMRSAKANQDVQETSLKRLEDAALDPELKKRIAACGGAEAIIEAMYEHPLSTSVQEHACAVLGNQASNSEEQQKALVEQGAVRVVIKAMYEYPDSFRIQETSCWALREFALNEEGRKEITDCGGIEWILRAMQAHPAAVAVLEHGCMALAYLAYEAQFRKAIAWDGGVNTVLRSMKSQPDDSVVQEAACLSLRNLGCSKEPQHAILELCGDEVIAQAMRTHLASPSLLETACDALQILAPPPKRLFELGVLELVSEAMKRHSEVESLQVKACKLFAYAGNDSEARVYVRRFKGIELANAAQAAFPRSPEVQEAARQAVSALARE